MRFFNLHLSLLVAVGLIALPALAKDRSMSIDDVLAIERLDQATVSPDGRLVAAVVLRSAGKGEIYGRTAYEVDPSRGDVWILDRQTGARRNLTDGQSRAAGAWCAMWSPDGKRMAFLSTRPEGAEPRGGANVWLYVWERSKDLFYRASDRAIATQTRYGAGMHKMDLAGPNTRVSIPCAVGNENPPFVWLDESRLLVVTLPTGRLSGLFEVTERTYRHLDATRLALRAGNAAYVSAAGSGTERTKASADEVANLSLVDLKTRRTADIASVPAYPFSGSLAARVSPDGRRAAVLATTAAISPTAGVTWTRNDGEWAVEKQLGFVELAEAQTIKWVSLPAFARLPVVLGQWISNGQAVSFTARADPRFASDNSYAIDRLTGKVTIIERPPSPTATTRPTGLPPTAELIAKDEMGMVWSENTPLGTFIRSRVNGEEPRELLALNRHLAAIDFGRTIGFEYTSGNGTSLKAAVLLPPNYREGVKLPVITWVYGGATVPGWADYSLDPFSPGIYNLRLYAARGYAVLIPSIPLRRDGKQDPLFALEPAVAPAVDKLVAIGIADPARVGVMGQSFGGYSALGLATQSNRFRAVVALAPLSDLIAYYGAFDPTARGYPGIEHEKSANPMIAELTAPAAHDSPYENPDYYRQNSPLTFVDKVTAPVLLIHGENDVRGSSYQSEAFFNGLWRQGKTARILRYWGEDHALAASPATVRSVADEIVSWFDKYLAESVSGQKKSDVRLQP